jgi:hypothetical protein
METPAFSAIIFIVARIVLPPHSFYTMTEYLIPPLFVKGTPFMSLFAFGLTPSTSGGFPKH